NPPRRLSIGFLENNVAGGLVDGKWWPEDYSLTSAGNSGTTSPREWFFIFDVNYSETQNAALATNVYYNVMPVMYAGMPLRRAGDLGTFAAGDKITLYANHPNLAVDAWKFSTAGVTFDNNLAKEDVEKINVFPNPYYAVNPQELNKYQKFVTFSHLPADATLRVFNLAGQLVKTIRKETADQFQRWDLNNEDGLPVASGLYIVHIDMPKIGKTKVLKVAVIQEQQILDRF
ncbi:MAG: T9SS type A sorting domain-containing protein, partial [Syntrophothermus sp.]